MATYFEIGSESTSLTSDDIRNALTDTFKQIGKPEKALLLPPDHTRLFSRAGEITSLCYEILGDAIADIMPALGTHSPMKPEQLRHMFPDVPLELFRPHRWRDDVVTLGTVPASFVSDVTAGLYNRPWEAQVNKLLRDGGHDLIFSIGQVVPHEVIGMANYNKNIFVGTGGAEGINESHYLSAVYGIEQTLGRAEHAAPKDLEFCPRRVLRRSSVALRVDRRSSKCPMAQLAHARDCYIGDDHQTFFHGRGTWRIG